MKPQQQPLFTPVDGRVFEDIIDGYFPLRVSLSHMMERNGFAVALVSLSHAPIAAFSQLPAQAPVPLNIQSGRAGLIDEVILLLTRSDKALQISGYGAWRWLDGDDQGDDLDPMVRLAEPAFVQGVALETDGHKADTVTKTRGLGSGAHGDLGAMLSDLGWSAARVWGPVPSATGIFARPTTLARVFGCAITADSTPDFAPGSYLLVSAQTID